MKLSVFTTKEQFAEWSNKQADLIEQNGLRQERETLDKAVRGIGKNEWLSMNNIPEDIRDEEWKHHIEYIRRQIRHLERKVRRYRKDAEQAMRMA